MLVDPQNVTMQGRELAATIAEKFGLPIDACLRAQALHEQEQRLQAAREAHTMNGETAQQAVQRVLAQQAEKEAEQQAKLQALRDQAAKDAAVKAKEHADAEQAKAERLQQQQAASFEAEHKPGLLAAWQATGGSVDEFEKLWPAMRTQLQIDTARQQDAAARASMATNFYRDF